MIHSVRFALLLPSSASIWIWIRFTVVKAVSADEKNAERQSMTINSINRMSGSVSKFVTPYF